MEKIYKILKLLIWVLAFAVVLVGARALYSSLSVRMEMPGLVTQETQSSQESQSIQETAPAVDSTEETRQTAPDFTVYDLEGNPHKLSDFRGKPVILNFWASWCGPCRSEMPEFQEFYGTYGEQIHFLLVNLTDGFQETVDSASGFVQDQGYTFPVFFDTDVDAAATYGVNSVPVTYFLDAEGCFVAWAQGALSANILQQGVDMLLG